jgi:hypothetical protein
MELALSHPSCSQIFRKLPISDLDVCPSSKEYGVTTSDSKVSIRKIIVNNELENKWGK